MQSLRVAKTIVCFDWRFAADITYSHCCKMIRHLVIADRANGLEHLNSNEVLLVTPKMVLLSLVSGQSFIDLSLQTTKLFERQFVFSH